MRKSIMALLLLTGTAPAIAQQTPFDMTPEQPVIEDATPLPTPQTPAETGSQAAPAPTPAPFADVRRHLLPEGNLSLPGEYSARSWAAHLTAAQAASPAKLHLGYQNAVVAAPESSRLQVLINNVIVLDESVRSADGVSAVDVDVPSGVLLAGRNEVSIRVRHRHRTDCTVESTYELWTQVDSASTYLAFANADANTFDGIGDLRALAPDATGRTQIEIVAPALARNDVSSDILTLAQAIALHTNQTNMEFSIGSTFDAARRDVALRVFLGTSDDIERVSGGLAEGFTEGVIAHFQQNPQDGVPTLIVGGRDRAEWTTAINQILAPVDRAARTGREALITEAWSVPNAPMIYDERRLAFADLGIPSEQFSGRRYVRSFNFSIPSDFYARSYGEARILLDAAYSPAVLPGSSINVYVNGNIAASMPLTERGGAILNKFPIKVTMRHFQPGLNEVVVEAALLTEQDRACLPGASSDTTARFAMFGTSQFVVPDFGRIAQFPNLAATSGTGYPYGLSGEPLAIVLERDSTASLSAAASVLARVAIAAGRSIPLSSTMSIDAARQQDAIFIGAINSIPAGVLRQVGVAEDSRTGWIPETGAPPGSRMTDETNVQDWRTQLDRRNLSDVEDWFSRTFDITQDMLRFAPADDEAFIPSQGDIMFLAQGTNPEGNGVWTVITAPDQSQMTAGISAVADRRMWDRLSGRLSVLESDLTTLTSRPVAQFSFVETRPPSFANYRLIVANWFSANILSYSLLLVLACLLLGMATSGLLSRLGRRR